MKSKIITLLGALLMAPMLFSATDERLVTIFPEKPAIGKELTIRYNPAIKGAMLFGVKEMEVQILLMRSEGTPRLLESQMAQQGKAWEAKILLVDTNATFGLMRFVSGETVDNNQDKFWDFLVHDQNGTPVEGAHLACARSFMRSSAPDFRREKDMARAREETEKEFSFYPDRRETKFAQWQIELSENRQDSTVMRKIEGELDAMAEQYADDDKVLQTISSWYGRVRQADKQKALQNQLIEKDPKGKFAQQIRLQEIFRTRDADKRGELTLAFLKDFPDIEPKQKSTMANLLLNAKLHNKAEEILASIDPPNGNLLNSFAWKYIEQDINVERGVELAKQGVEALRNAGKLEKPWHLPQKSWKRSRRNSLGFVLDTYAFGLFKLGRYEEAQKAYREAYDLTEGSNADINERLVESYVKNGDYKQAVTVAQESIERSKYDDKLLEHGKTAYERLEGSTEGFDKLVATAKERARESQRKSPGKPHKQTGGPFRGQKPAR